MAESGYERLSGQDRAFLVWESPTAHMHVAATMIFDAEPVRTSSGGIDVDRIRQYVGSRLDQIPRYRQRLAEVQAEIADAMRHCVQHLRLIVEGGGAVALGALLSGAWRPEAELGEHDRSGDRRART